MIFEGFEPWSTNKPEVELRTPAGLIDLFNCADFTGFEYIPPGTLIFRFSYEAPSEIPRQHPSALVELGFQGTRNVSVTTDRKEEGHDADTLSHVTYVESSPGVGMVEIAMHDGLRVSFHAERAQLKTEPWAQ